MCKSNVQTVVAGVMVRQLDHQQFKSLLKYAISYNYNPDASRCNSIDVVLNDTRYSITICFNEKKHQACICEVFRIITKMGEYKGKMAEIDYRNPEGEEISEEFKEKCFYELLRLVSGDWNMSEKGIDIYEFYKKKFNLQLIAVN